MYGLNLKTISDICSGSLINCQNPDAEPERIIIDSREARKGDLFAAFAGENVDGHNFISSALSSGAVCCLVERIPDGVYGAVILVESVEEAVASISEYFRRLISIPVIGITGSNGKTTAKEMISCVLSECFNVLKTDKNLNNQIGVPMTVSSINREHTAAVVEMGVSKKRDMELLGRIVRPDIMVYTNIGHSHLEYLDDLNGVLFEKSKAVNYMSDDATVIVNGDDPNLMKLKCSQNVISYGLNECCNVWADSVKYSIDENMMSMNIHMNGETVKANVPSFGSHMVYACLEAASVAMVMGIDSVSAVRGIEKYKPVGRRSLLCQTGFLTLIDDCYNSNPDSLKNSIDSMFLLPGRHICILGDMLELGENSRQLHRKSGEYAVSKGADLVITIGKLASEIAAGAGDKGISFGNAEEALNNLQDLLEKDDVVLVKASRGMHLEVVSEFVKKMNN